MKIFGISAFNLSSKNTTEQKHKVSSLNKAFIQHPFTSYERDTFTRQKTDISFGANLITSQSKFKRLVRTRTMHCIYCNKVLVDEEALNRLEKSGVFSGPIKNFTAQTKQYYKSMHKAHKTVFRMIADYASKSPQTTLEQVMQALYPKALKHLRKSQKPLFDKLKNCAKSLPPEYKEKFSKFMKIQNCKLTDKPFINQFSAKEFNYNLFNMCKTVGNDRLRNIMFNNASHLTHPSFKEKDAAVPDNILFGIFNINAKHNSNLKRIKDELPKSKENIMLQGIYNIRLAGQKLSRNDIIELCDRAIHEIMGIPVKVPFSNKTFRYDLNELLTGLPDENLKRKMLNITKDLPTSMENPYSFITKHATASSEKVGHNLLFPSIVTIEHMKTKYDKGKNIIGNYALCCAFDNNFVRSNRNMNIVLNHYNPENPQKYFNEIFEVVKDGELSLEDALEQVATFQEQSGRKIDTSTLDGFIPKPQPHKKKHR